MTENRASSGVRNLRAMFENPSATSSPEPRGRSPASRLDADSNSRPTSKIRASFVPVEGTTRIAPDLGATKGTPSGVNDPHAHRRGSFSVSEDLGDSTAADLKRVVSEEKEARKKSTAIAEAVPEEAVASRPSSRPAPPIRQTSTNMPNLGSIMKGSDFPEPESSAPEKPVIQELPRKAVEPVKPVKAAAAPPTDAPGDKPDKVVPGVQEEATVKPGDSKDQAAVSGGQTVPPPTEPLPPSTSAAEGSKAATGTPANSHLNGAAKTATTNGKTPTKKPSAILTTKAPSTKTPAAKSPLPKSPGVARIPKTPTTPRAAPSASTAKATQPTKEAAKAAAPKEHSKAPAPKTSRVSLRQSTIGTTASAAAKAKAPVQEAKKPVAKPASSAPKESTTTSPGGFKKPKPRSPTRPVRLPSHLTAPTASSAAKHEDDTQKLTRKPSVVSRSNVSKTAPAARKQPSRASLAPSTASTTKRPESRTSTRGGADEGFLARMMRPTTASASKTHDKVSSPPRRGASVRAPAGSAVAKGKKKVTEVAEKAKEAITTNGHSSEGDHAEAPAAESSLPPAASDAVAGADAPVQVEREATPTEQVDSSAGELPTQNLATQTIH